MDYRQYRQKGYPAHVALACARWDARPLELDWSGDVGTLERDGFEVRVTVTPDDWPRELGTFTDVRPDTYERAYRTPGWDALLEQSCGQLWHRPRDSRRYYVPDTGTLEEHRRGYHGLGYSRHAAHVRAFEIIREDVRRACSDDQVEYVVVVKVSRAGVELGSASLGGVDVDDGPRDFEEILEDHGLIDEALEEARGALARLCR